MSRDPEQLRYITESDLDDERNASFLTGLLLGSCGAVFALGILALHPTVNSWLIGVLLSFN